MGRVFKPNLADLMPYEQDDTTTTNIVYTRYGSGTRNEYIERQQTVSPYRHQWGWGEWVNRASLSTWVNINLKYIDF